MVVAQSTDIIMKEMTEPGCTSDISYKYNVFACDSNKLLYYIKAYLYLYGVGLSCNGF